MSGLHGLLTGKCKVRAYNGYSSTSTFWLDPVEVDARVEYGNELVRDDSGTEVVSSARVFIAPWPGPPPVSGGAQPPMLDVRSLIMLPEDGDYDDTPTTTDSSVGRSIATIGLVRDEHGRASHLEVSLL